MAWRNPNKAVKFKRNVVLAKPSGVFFIARELGETLRRTRRLDAWLVFITV